MITSRFGDHSPSSRLGPPHDIAAAKRCRHRGDLLAIFLELGRVLDLEFGVQETFGHGLSFRILPGSQAAGSKATMAAIQQEDRRLSKPSTTWWTIALR